MLSPQGQHDEGSSASAGKAATRIRCCSQKEWLLPVEQLCLTTCSETGSRWGCRFLLPPQALRPPQHLQLAGPHREPAGQAESALQGCSRSITKQSVEGEFGAEDNKQPKNSAAICLVDRQAKSLEVTDVSSYSPYSSYPVHRHIPEVLPLVCVLNLLTSLCPGHGHPSQTATISGGRLHGLLPGSDSLLPNCIFSQQPRWAFKNINTQVASHCPQDKPRPLTTAWAVSLKFSHHTPRWLSFCSSSTPCLSSLRPVSCSSPC